MIQLTVERILPLVKMEDIYISTNRDYKELVRQQLPEIPEENILLRTRRPQYRALHWPWCCAYAEEI